MARGWGIRNPFTASRRAGDVGRSDPDSNPGAGLADRSIRALDLGLAPMSAFAVRSSGLSIGSPRGAAGCGAVQHLWSDRGSWVDRPLKRNLVRLGPLD